MTTTRRRLEEMRRSALKRLVPERIWPEYVDYEGVSVPVRGQPFSFGIKRLLLKGDYEAPERALVKAAIRPGMHVLEMGGSIGVVTAVLLRAVGPAGEVISIEASAALSDQASKWVSPLGPARFICGFGFPVWELPRDFTVRAFDDGSGSLGGSVAFEYDGNPTVSRVEPSNWDLRRVCEECDFQPNALVADIEGSELVIKDIGFNIPIGLSEIILELHPTRYPKGSQDTRAIIDAIERSGFRLRQQIGDSIWLSKQ